MSTEKILSSDGIPLEESLKKAERKNKLKAVLLVAPLFLFILIIYIFPIGDMLFRSVDDRMITKMLPNTFKAMEQVGRKRSCQRSQFTKVLYDDLSLY
jgi:putative spermidine/putrescine transport system permease protein